MIAAVDTNILLDILIPDERHLAESKKLLEDCLAKGSLIICEIVYAELASQFASEGELRLFLADTGIRLMRSNEGVLHEAGVRWAEYSRQRGKDLRCGRCGARASLKCPECTEPFMFRQRVLADFLVAAHAVAEAEVLLSRDRAVYGGYFGDLRVAGSSTELRALNP